MKRVAVLRGGTSSEYQASMLSGNAVLRALTESEYPHRDITITKTGDWLAEGRILTQEQALEGIDTVFVALHGAFGEEGQVQRILQRKGIPFTGSRALASAVAFNKELTKQSLRTSDIKLARHRRISRDEQRTLKDDVDQMIIDLGTEVFVKPVANDLTFGAKRASGPEQLHDTLLEMLESYDSLLIEEYVAGTEATVGVLGNFRDEALYTLPALEIIRPFDQNVSSNSYKFDDSISNQVPGRFSPEIKRELARVAKLVHETVNCEQYSRSDFIVRGDDVYFLEISSHPTLDDLSLFTKSAEAVGLDFKSLIIHLLKTAK